MIAGTLELQMTTDLVKLITGTQQASRQVVGSMKQIEDAARSVKSVLEGLGVGLSLGALVGFAKSTIDAIARMKDLGEVAGTTAQAMSKFEAPTRLAGSSLDATAAAMARLSRAAIEARDPTSKSAQALAAIGISTKQIRDLSPDQLFELIARQLDKYSDGLSKNAVMQQILGRAGAEMNGTMKAIAQTTELHATVTQKDADEAKRLEEEIVKLRMTGDAFWRAVASSWVGTLTDFVAKLTEIEKGMGFWKQAMLGIAAIFGIDLTAQLGTTADKILALKNRIIDLNHAIAEQKAVLGENAAGVIKRYTDQIAVLQKQLDQLQGTGKARQAPSYGAGGEEGFMAGGMPSKPAPDFNPAAKAAADAYKQEAQSLDQIIAKLKGQGELEAYIKKLEEDRFAMLLPKQKQELIDKEKQILALQDQKKAMDAAVASVKAYVDALDKADEVVARFNEAATQQTSDLQFQNSLLGKSSDEQAKLTALRQADLDLLKQIDALPPELSQEDFDAEVERLTAINDLRKQGIATTLDQKKAIEDQLSVWGELGDKAGQFFSDLIEHGRGAFQDLKNMAKQFFAEMVALFAKRLILQLGASVTGSMGMTAASAALTSQAGSVGQGSLAGNAMNALGGLGSSFSGGLASIVGVGSGLGGGIYGAFAGSALGQAMGLSVAGSAVEGTALASGATLTGLGESVAAIIPVIGWIIAIAAILYSIFGSKGGGTKQQGAFAGLFSGTGNFLGNVGNAENIANIHGTQDESNAQAQVIGQAMARGLVQSVTSLGGTNTAFQLFSAFAMDPAGTAPSFFHGGLRDASGQEYFRYQNDNLSRDPKEFQQQVQAIMSRFVVAALQHDTTLPDAIQRWVHTIDAATASDADIDRIIKGAAALKSLYAEMDSLKQAIDELNDPTGITAIKDSLQALDKSVTDAKKALDVAAASGDPEQYMAAEQAYRQAIVNRYQQEISMVRQLQSAIRATEEQAYQFAVAIAQRINAVGGNVDIAAIAMGRATSLRDRITNSGEPLSMQVEDVQSYVGAIDTWYQTRREAILADAQKQADAINAASQAHIEQLQHELDLVNQMKAIIDQAKAMSKDMELSASNPLAARGRLAIAQSDVAALRAQYLGATTDADRVKFAQQLLAALGTERGLLESTFQRPSNDYVAGYNQIQADLALLGEKAQSIDQQQLDLTQQISDASKITADAAQIAAPELAALDSQARDYYTWAQTHGIELFNMQRDAYQAQLMAITGGSDPELYIAQKTSEMRDLLQQLVNQNQQFLDNVGTPAGTGTGGGSGGGSGGGAPSGGGSDGNGNPLRAPATGKSVHFSFTVANGEDVVSTVLKHATTIKRAIAKA